MLDVVKDCDSCVFRSDENCSWHDRPLARLNSLCGGKDWSCVHYCNANSVRGTIKEEPVAQNYAEGAQNYAQTVSNGTGVSWVLKRHWGRINTGSKRQPEWAEYWADVSSSEDEAERNAA